MTYRIEHSIFRPGEILCAIIITTGTGDGVPIWDVKCWETLSEVRLIKFSWVNSCPRFAGRKTVSIER